MDEAKVICVSTNWNASKGCGPTAGRSFNVMLVYEDKPSALRGLALYQRLVSELGEDCEFNLSVWKFAVLGVGRLAELSAVQAAEADLIIACPREGAEPTEQVQAWFQRWVDAKRRNDCALVVLGRTAAAPEPERRVPTHRADQPHEHAGAEPDALPASMVGEQVREEPEAAPAPAEEDGFFHTLARRSGVAVFPPRGTASDATTRTDGHAWLSRRAHAPGPDGWFHDAHSGLIR